MTAQTKTHRPYSTLQIRLHWVVALLIALQWWAGESMHEVQQVLQQQGDLSFGQFLVSTLHSFGGLVILALALWRVRIRRQHPGQRSQDRKIPLFFQRLARLNHFCLYALIGLMVISGLLSYYHLLPAAGFHGYCAQVLKILVLLHVMAALYHHFVRKDGVLASMWFEKPRR